MATENKTASLTLKDSGERRDFSTGSRRDVNKGKLRTDLLPVTCEFYEAAHFAMGSMKYGDRNWELGQPIMTYWESLKRHTLYAGLGAVDENHWAGIRWNTMAIQHTLLMIKHGKLPAELDNRPFYMMPGNPIGAELLETFKTQAEATLKMLEEKMALEKKAAMEPFLK